MSRSGYTLPVFAVAAAKSALLHLQSVISSSQPSATPTHSTAHSEQLNSEQLNPDPLNSEQLNPDPLNSDQLNPDQLNRDQLNLESGAFNAVQLDLLDGNGWVEISVPQVASLSDRSALAIAFSDPGDNLDLTRNTPIWAQVSLGPRQEERLILAAGEGLGRSLSGEPAIYSYARRLFEANLEPLLAEDQTAWITIVLPQGRALAQRTSNAAFGIVEGLSLLGTSGISNPLSAEAHFVEYQQNLREKAARSKQLTFCLGSNGLRVADRLGIDPEQIVQTGNWVGALLVEAGLQSVESVHLLGYQGKLIKLAGGIFNTSSHLADAKLEILAAALIQVGGDRDLAQVLLAAPTADAAYLQLRETEWCDRVFDRLTRQINHKAQRYVQKYADVQIAVRTTLFDRQGGVILGS